SVYSLGRFPVFLFSIIIAFYLLFHPARSIQSITAGVYFLFASLFHFGFLFAHSVNHPFGAYGYYLTALSPFGIAILIQFAYIFPRDYLIKERKIVLWITAIISLIAILDYSYFAYTSGVGAFTAGYGSYYISKLVPYSSVAFYLWSIFIFIRKTIYHSRTFHAENKKSFSYLFSPGGKEAITSRNFALLNLLELINTSILTSGLLFRMFPYIHFLTLMNISFFAINTFYVILFLRYLSGSTPISFKIINFGLLSSLILTIFAGNIQTIYAEKNFHSIRLKEIETILLLKDLNELPSNDALENVEMILHLRENGSEIIYQKSDLNIPDKLNLWEKTPGLIEYNQKPEYPNFSDLEKKEKEEFYLRLDSKNIQFYSVHYKGEWYGIGFNFLQYRKWIHPQILSLFSLYFLCLVINFLLLPLNLAKNFSQPLEEILSGLYEKTEMLLLPSRKNVKNELEILNETLLHIKEDIEQKEILQKEYNDLKEKLDETEDPKTKEGPLKDNTIQKVKTVEEYLKENYNYELSREGLASMVNLSPGRLGKYFKLSTGLKISEYINQLRVDRAKSLLIETNKTVIEIAFEVGFESLRTFNRVFFSEMQMNPGQFRQKNQTI
ncbi:MAG TPA: AraC family transcriptional regulator, partial [Leptospiraceae bacterium]|nr:AraC family transcriptional regulator [Leptospiraceae bacterium]